MANDLSPYYTSIQVDGHELLTTNLSIHIDLVQGFFEPVSKVRGTDTVIPRAAGEIVRNRISDSRDLLLQGFVRGITGSTQADLIADFMSNINSVINWFSPVADPPPVLTVVTRHATAQTWSINIRPLPSIILGHEVPSYSSITIPCISVDPSWTEVV